MHFMIIDTYEIIDFISGENIIKTLYFIEQSDYKLKISEVISQNTTLCRKIILFINVKLQRIAT